MALKYIGSSVHLVIDRPLGSRHPTHGFEYMVNYGHVPGTCAPDGEELDAYYLLADKPLHTAEGRCIAIIHRRDDDDDKLVVVPEDTALSDEQIRSYVLFQEQWFDSVVMREPLPEGERMDGGRSCEAAAETSALSRSLAEAEGRLQISLPPSYRSFLLQPQRVATLGEGGDACALRSAEELCWARDDAALLDFMAGWDEGASGSPDVGEDEHRATTDDPTVFRRAFVDASLLISHVGGSFHLLNPAVVQGDGEFEAWHVAPWYPGAARWRSFDAMLADLAGLPEDADDSADPPSPRPDVSMPDGAWPAASMAWGRIATCGWECEGVTSSSARGLPCYCDGELVEAVPRERFDRFLQALVEQASALDDACGRAVPWEALPTREDGAMANGLGGGSGRVRAWHHPTDESCRLEVWDGSTGETAEDGLAALQAGELVLVAGCAVGHPYVMCNLFTFGNSDGSSEWEGVGAADSAADVIARLAEVAATYCYEQIH